MKTINETQIKQILDELMKLNIPVQLYVGIQEMFLKLPDTADAQLSNTPKTK